MSRCLSERTLVRVSDGDATVAERQHLAECGDCSARARSVVRDVARLSLVLRGEPPPLPPRRAISRVWWMPASAVVATALVVLTLHHAPTRPATADAAPLSLAEVSEVAFAADPTPGDADLERADLVALDEAIDGSWPDEGDDQ
jgi:hypothetical protein